MSAQTFLNNAVTLMPGDCREVLATLPDASVDAIVCDPPYLLEFMGKSWDQAKSELGVSPFAAWLAGFIAGEGCFRIQRHKDGRYYTCTFQIHTRADEAPVLRSLQQKIGGRVVYGKERVSEKGGRSNLDVRWLIESREDCWALAKVLDGAPLFAKKADDYRLWRRALQIWTDTPKANRWSAPRDVPEMALLHRQLQEVKVYDEAKVSLDIDPFMPPMQAFHYEWAREALRVLKPGGHLLAFGGTRTYHRLACAIEDAGFEVRDCIMWVYGCLDADTMAVGPSGPVAYSDLKVGNPILSYDIETGTYQWDHIEDVFIYEVDDTVYRIKTDHGDQLVSRNHRCIVERGGVEAFRFAEEAARQCEARVPVLEDLHRLLEAIRDERQGSGSAEQDVLSGVRGGADRSGEKGLSIATQPAAVLAVRSMREDVNEAAGVASKSQDSSLLSAVQRRASGCRVEAARPQGQGCVEAGIRGGLGRALHRIIEPIVEGWRHVSEQARQLCECALCPVPAGVSRHVTARWLRDGASPRCGAGAWPTTDEGGVCASHRPRSTEQRAGEPDAVRQQPGSQAVRGREVGHRTVVGRITAERYRGVIWCVRVRTGAFVAVRNGMAFPTGNSGFPKSLDVSKAIDKAAGAEREKVATGAPVKRMIPGADQNGTGSWVKDNGRIYQPGIEIPATDAARKWQGWGTALKPSVEPIVLARKPLIGTVAANVLAHGTGALNIDGCRVALNGDYKCGANGRPSQTGLGDNYDPTKANQHSETGRFPANLIHDGSDEVLAGFPSDAGASMLGTEGSKASVGSITGERARVPGAFRSDTGSAARFFYSSKADASDRLGSKHPTVKPIDLMQYLVRLVCPKGGTVLDPFAGTGTTGEAAWREGMRAILIEREPEYQADIARRMELANKPTKRAAVAATKNNLQGHSDLPLFIDVQGSE
jgi:DNA modification methylase